jgi:hypothetical protein
VNGDDPNEGFRVEKELEKEEEVDYFLLLGVEHKERGEKVG